MKTQRFRYLLSIALCIALLLSMIPTAAYGASATSIGDLTLTATKNLSGKGYTWDAKTRTLTLENANLSGSFRLPSSGNITILLKGENTITVPSSSKGISAFDTYSRNLETVTIKGDGTGSLKINGFFHVSRADTLRIENCILSVNSNNSNISQTNSWGTFITTTDTYITNSRLYLSDGMNLGGNHIIDNSYIEVHDDNLTKIGSYVDVDGDFSLINQSELHVELNHSSGSAIDGMGDFYADETSIIEIATQGKYSMYIFGDINLQSERLYLSSADQLFFISYKVIDDEISDEYAFPSSITLPAGAEYQGSMEEVKELDYTAPSYTQRMERIKAGVEATTIALRSAYTAKGNIQLTWKKSPGYRVDYYEVFRSTKRYSGYTKKAFYTTAFGLNNTYTNTLTKAGTMYYYKVRGVREIDGVKYYTQWSTKAWRRAK